MLAQLLNGLASASSLFLLSVGLTLIFGVSRVVNFAHGSLAMLGLYVGITLSAPSMSTFGPAAGFWLAVVAAAVIVGAGGAVVERILLRRLYGAAELFQLLATFALVLIVRDATLAIWGADDLLGPRAPGLAGMVGWGRLELPAYDFALMGIGVVVLIALQALLTRSRWGLRVRAATEDREMAQALGLDERRLYTQVFALGAALAGLAGALQMPQQPATLSYDLNVVVEAFVVTIIGGMGSVPGAFIAAMAIGAIKALCVAMGTVSVLGLDIAWPKLTLVIEFLLMAVVLAFRPWGLFGRAVAAARAVRVELSPLAAPRRRDDLVVLLIVALLAVLPLLVKSQPYVLVLAIDVLISAVFAASLHALMGPAGIASFGHAAYLGLGAYGAALSAPWMAARLAPLLGTTGAFGIVIVLLCVLVGMACAAVGAAVFGFVVVRAAGVYGAMLTLAFAQIVWSVVFQWDGVTGGSNGLFGSWPQGWLGSSQGYYWFVLAMCTLAGLWLRQVLHAPFGLSLRAARDAPLRARTLGLPVGGIRWAAFVGAGALAGLAGALTVFAKGSVSPDVVSISKSVDGLVMVLLGGLESLAGPWLGAAVYTVGQDFLARATEYWRAAIGVAMLILILLVPGGLSAFRMPGWRRSGSGS